MVALKPSRRNPHRNDMPDSTIAISNMLYMIQNRKIINSFAAIQMKRKKYYLNRICSTHFPSNPVVDNFHTKNEVARRINPDQIPSPMLV